MVKYLSFDGNSNKLRIDIRHEIYTCVIPISSGKKENILKRYLVLLRFALAYVKIYMLLTR